jgi:hypothetical protein
MIKLFDYINVLFGTDSQWDKLSNYDKAKNEFMTRRFMSIKFPNQANLFNVMKTDPVGQAESWRLIGSKFNRVPGFIYTKVKNLKKNKAWVPNQNAVDEYLKINQIGQREFNEALKFNPTAIKESIESLEKQMSNDVN